MEIDYSLPPVMYALGIIRRIEKVWLKIERGQECADKGIAGIVEDKKKRVISIYMKDKNHIYFQCSKTEWIWYKFFKKTKLGLK